MNRITAAHAGECPVIVRSLFATTIKQFPDHQFKRLAGANSPQFGTRAYCAQHVAVRPLALSRQNSADLSASLTATPMLPASAWL